MICVDFVATKRRTDQRDRDHPSARGQKRHVEEKGPFGKSTRRKGSSRTRTTTPAKKENPTLDGFDRALKYDAQLAAEQQAANATARAQVDGNLVSRNTPSHTKEPTQIMIYGYTPSRCYAAIDLYEKVSGGMICEDYPREPPSELQKYQTPLSTSWSVHSRPRTRQEMALANKYAGGNCWIKLTCDSAEAAARAVELSPRQVYGHWVYAELYNGKAPENDQPIPITEEDRSEGPFNSPRPPRKSSQTLSAAFSQHATTQKRANSTLPRNFTSKPDFQAADNGYSASPSTASSATATGADNSTLRNRHESQTEQSTVTTRPDEIAPGIPRYILRPESEALLPQKTWWERQYQWLSAKGLIPGDFIGNQLPILDNGEFDWANASWYWRSCYWLDSHIGTDICGLKEKDE